MFGYYYASPVGRITILSNGSEITDLWIEGQPGNAEGLKNADFSRTIPVIGDAQKWLDIYFCGKNPGFTPKLKYSSTPFRNEVWDILLKIPYGSVTTYGEIAAVIAQRRNIARMSAQAVGGAVGKNPISIIIPCHRVIGSDKSLTGYAGGIEIKRRLLSLEHAELGN